MRKTPAMEQRWNKWLQDAGMTPLKWRSAYKVTSRLLGREGGSDPELEIGEFKAPLEEETTGAIVERQYVRVATSASILAGKWWGRRTHAPVRDLYDIVVAGVRDPEALQQALQTGDGDGAIDEFLTKMIEKRDQYRKSAEEGHELKGTVDEYESAVRNPAWWAGWTVARWAITELRVERTEKGWETSTLCEATPQGAHCATHRTVEEATQFAQRVGQLSHEERERLTSESRRHGGGTTPGKGAGKSVAMTRSVEASPEGEVIFKECGRVVAQAPSVEAGVEVGLAQGNWSKKELAAAMQEIEVRRTKAPRRGIARNI